MHSLRVITCPYEIFTPEMPLYFKNTIYPTNLQKSIKHLSMLVTVI